MNFTASHLLGDAAFAIHDATFNRFKMEVDDRGDMPFSKYKEAVASGQRALMPKRLAPIHLGMIENVIIFAQMWSSTALGFSGMGGSAMTTANTVVVVHGGEAAVYFGARFAYMAKYDKPLLDDIARQRLVSVSEAQKYNPEAWAPLLP